MTTEEEGISKRMRICEDTSDTVYYGRRETSDLVIKIGSHDTQVTTLHVHWEVLASFVEYFASMKSSQLLEAQNNVVSFPKDEPLAWRSLMKRLYSPFSTVDLRSAVQVLPVAFFLDVPWLTSEIVQAVKSKQFSAYRSVALAAELCANGQAALAAEWFKENSDWSIANAKLFATECQNIELVRAVNDFLFVTLKVAVVVGTNELPEDKWNIALR
jgi:BTB/POZ domain